MSAGEPPRVGRAAGSRPPEGRSLFVELAIRLAAVAVGFAILNVFIVLTMYAHNGQALAADRVERQANRVAVEVRRGAGSDLSARLIAIGPPLGASAWGYAVIDGSFRATAGRGLAIGPGSPFWPTSATLDWTRRDRSGKDAVISGARRLHGPRGDYWVLVALRGRGTLFYLPVIAQELLAHVLLPLAPLTVLLVLFNIQVVRRMLAPLSAAAAEVDALDPAHMEARLSEPGASREVQALVRAVNRALDRLQRAMVLLKEFTADAAHELRTPLSVLYLRIDSLPESPARTRLREDVAGMTRLVNQMLDLAQADALEMEGAREVDLLEVAREIVTLTAPLAFAGGRDIRLDDFGAPPVLGHAEALGRALRNVVENAIAHTLGEAPIEVCVGPGPRLAVRDHGPGVPPGEVQRLFQRFWRGDRRREGGAGLGLGIVRSIVEAHGGSVAVQPAHGGGSVFLLSFPAAGGRGGLRSEPRGTSDLLKDAGL